MRKIVLFAVAIVAMASCTQKIEPVNAGRSDQRIMFETPVVAPATKADYVSGPVEGTVFSTDYSFKVYAKYSAGDLAKWSTATDYFTAGGLKVEYTANVKEGRGSWHTNPDKYWPKTGKLSFSAVFPHDAAFTVGDKGVALDDYTAILTKGDQVDLLYSNRVINQQGTAAETFDDTDNLYGVQLPFHHALAQVTFSAKLKENSGIGASDHVKIKEIILKNVNSVADFTQGLVEAGNGSGAGTPAWSDHKTLADYANVVTNSDLTLTTTANTTNWTPILVIPGATWGSSKIYIKYDLSYNGVTETNIVVEKDLSALTYSDSSAGFAIGKKYTYNIEFGLDKIYFAPTAIDDWQGVTVSGGIDI